MNALPAEVSKHKARACVSSGSVWVYVRATAVIENVHVNMRYILQLYIYKWVQVLM